MEVRSPGRWVQFIAVGHACVGVTLYGGTLREIVRDGVVDGVGDHGERAAAFWFMVAGPALWTVGGLLRAAEERDDAAAQRAAGAALTAIAAAGVAAMPRSGFWTLLAAGAAAWRRGAR